MRAKVRSVFPVAALAVLVTGMVAGCAWLSSAVKTFEDMTPKERSLWMMSVYNKQYAEYEAAVADTSSLTEGQRVVLRLKKKALVKAWPLIKAYNAMLQTGVFSEETQAKAFEAIETLLGIGGQSDG